MATVSILQGTIRGSKCYTDAGTEYFEFLGIPYAKPPVGDLRFKSPQLPDSWDGIRDATTVSQDKVACQMDLFKSYPIGTEDCLYLNVYTPTLPKNDEASDLLPVMVQIHGGGFLHGNGVIKSVIGPDYLIDNNVIVVSINYRLGIFGFLSLDIPEAAGNMGLKDQVQALKWVQNNIAKFGGDKNNVTIFGYSAGAASIEYLILSHKSEGLFQKAILQSGSSLNHWSINFEPETLIKKVMEHLGYQGLNNNQAIYEYLMNSPPILLTEETFNVIQKSSPERLFFGFVPTVERDFGNDDAFITKNPYMLLQEGNFNKVHVIKGFCEMEGYLTSLIKPLAVVNLKKTENFLSHWSYPVEVNEHKEFNIKLANVYNKKGNKSDNDGENRIIDFFSDYDFISGILLSGRIMSDLGLDVYMYKFSYDGKINFLKNAFDIQKIGAAHADDVTFVFKTSTSNLADESDIKVRDKITKLWTNFAKTSNPAQPAPVSGVPTWPRFTSSSQALLNIDNEFTIESQQDTAKMDIFREIYEKYQK